MKTRIITILITLGAFLDQFYAILADNSGLLSELGVSPKATKIIFVLGILWNAFNKSLTPQKPKTFADGDGAGVPDKGL